MDGIDENHCEELEYNECEENEYRCQDGSCIPEEYWLDGEFDCSDKSDEQDFDEKIMKRSSCSLIPFEFDCDEATAKSNYFPCGDGEFVNYGNAELDHCYNYRSRMFFCEIDWDDRDKHPRWTLNNGHCVEKGWLEKKLTDMNESENCVLYLKCRLTHGAGDMCADVFLYFDSLCENRTIIYPSEPVLSPYVKTVYELMQLDSKGQPNYLVVNGSIKCIGQKNSYELNSSFIKWSDVKFYRMFDKILCREHRATSVRNPEIDVPCWRNNKQSFLCENSLECISKHRLRDGIADCWYGEDELKHHQCYMTNQQQHRLKCSYENSSICLSIDLIGNAYASCEELNDEQIVRLKWSLHEHLCRKDNFHECNILRHYISSSLPSMINEKMIPFRRYCDGSFDIAKGFDESSCKEWKCPRDNYQCLSGHCIPRDLLISERFQWICPDASDSIGFFRLQNLSHHNSQIVDYSYLVTKMFRLEFGYRPFPEICDFKSEYGCVLADVDEPLNFTVNRPCIHLSQIGDGIIDCYGGLDERNLLTCGKNDYEQRGFDFHCSNEECIPYRRLCKDRCSNNADDLLCVQLQTFKDPYCRYNVHIDACTHLNFPHGCYTNGIGNYYCDARRPSKKKNQISNEICFT